MNLRVAMNTVLRSFYFKTPGCGRGEGRSGITLLLTWYMRGEPLAVHCLLSERAWDVVGERVMMEL